MNHIIVRETSAEMKTIARNALRDNWQKVFIGMFVFYLLTSAIPGLINALLPNPFPTTINELTGEEVGATVGDLYLIVLQGAFQVGMCSFMIAFFRKRDIHPGYLFDGFENFLKSFCLLFVMGFFIFLWTLLLIIPGFIAAFRYSQAFYILADNPEKGVMECINESKAMMDGNKGRLFYTELSFFGWLLLASVPQVILDILLPHFGVLRVALTLIFSIPMMFVMIYMNTTQTVFYDLVSGNLIAKPEQSFADEEI